MTKLGGKIPQTAVALQEIPGIGPYTASAIASIAFDEVCVRPLAVHRHILGYVGFLFTYSLSLRSPLVSWMAMCCV